jgi:hypothetical protein
VYGESPLRPGRIVLPRDVSPRIEPRHEFVGTYIVPSVTVSVECWVLSWRRRKGNQWFHKSG